MALSDRFGPSGSRSERTRLTRYGWTLVLTVAAFGLTVATLAVDDSPIYAPLIAAVVVTAWLGGAGPAAFALMVGWILAFVAFVSPESELSLGSADDRTRWVVNFLVTAAIVLIALLLRRSRREATAAVDEVTSSLEQMAALQALSADLARASTSAEVSRAVAEHARPLVGADGAVLAVLDGDGLAVLGPAVGAEANVPERRLALDAKTLVSDVVATRAPARVANRAELEATYPDSAAWLPATVESAAAIPMATGARVIGVIEVLFDTAGAPSDDVMSLATTASELAAQALERARLYEAEQASRASFERILEVAPRFHAETEDEVTEAICREARSTFDADYGVLWRIRDGVLVLVRSFPVREEWPPELEVPLASFPGLDAAVAKLGVSFVPDVLAEARGEGLERVKQLGIRSSLRTPIVIGGRTELALVVSWRTVIAPPDPSTLAVARRFADQAGLAFEQLERRRAEARADLRADQTARLQEVTAGISRAATRGEVADTCLEHALRFVGAEAGFVVLTGAGGTSVQFVSDAGLSEEALDAWKALGLDADVPFAHAISTGEPVWALSPDEMGVYTAAPALEDAGWITIPLRTPASVHGALHVSLRRPTELGESERGWLQSVVSQCALALERSELYDREQRLRVQSQRLQRMTELLSSALTPRDVAEVVVSVAVDLADASSAVLLGLEGDRQLVRELASLPKRDGASIDDPSIALAAARGRAWLDASEKNGSGPRRLIPLVSGRRTVGVLDLEWKAGSELSDDDRGYLESLVGQAAQALDRARHIEAERSVAETLQRSVLPVSLPNVPGVQLAARYLPGTQTLDVGGDWFDAVELPDGRLGLVVGDVVGKGVHAAANMGQLRNALRALTVERLKPASALQRLDRLSDEVLETSFATVVYAVVDRETGTLRYSSAGHPPALVAYPDGRTVTLEDGRGLPLGTGLRSKYRQGVADLPAGSMIVLYSDGLVERRGRSIDEGIDALREAMRNGPTDAGPLLEHVLERLLGTEERGDDIAIVAARVSPVAPRPLDLRVASEQRSLPLVRSVVRAWLEGTTMTTPEAEEVLLATWEICANAVEHAQAAPEAVVRVLAEQDGATVRVVIEDDGQFVPATVRVDRGLGLKLADALSTSLTVTPSDRGTSVVLERSLVDRSEEPDQQDDDDDERE